MSQVTLELLKNPSDTSIPIPSVDASHLQNNMPAIPGRPTQQKRMKYEKEYDAFCRWAALPKEQRKPKRIADFEKENGIPKNYHQHFRQRDDYQELRTKYFYEWLWDIYPDLVNAAYNRAMRNSTADFKVLSEIISKRMEVDKPRVSVSPMLILGVPQEKLDKLMQPKPVPPIQEAQIVK